jgi:hypothetical protein
MPLNLPKMEIHDLNTHYEHLIPRSMAPYWNVTLKSLIILMQAIAEDLGSGLFRERGVYVVTL